MRIIGILLSILILPCFVSASEDPQFHTLSYDIENPGETIAKGDYNNDDYLDLAAYVNGAVRLFPGNGDGSFVNSEDNDIPAMGFNDIEMADLDRDGNLDLIESGGPQVFVRLGNGDGTFGPSQSFETASDSSQILAIDLNGDSILDLAVGNMKRFRANVLLGKGDGTFEPQISVGPTGEAPRTLTSADFNNDEKPDLAFACYKENFVSVMLNIGGGHFDPPTSLITGLKPQAVGAGDFNEDGDDDLLVHLEDDIHIYPGDGQGGFGSPYTILHMQPNPSVEVADVDEDGHLDFLFPSRLGWFGVFLGNGNGTFENLWPMKSSVLNHFLTAGDWDNNGELDVATIDIEYEDLNISMGLGDGSFGPNYYVYGKAQDVELVDLNGDGILDIAYACRGSAVFVQEGLGNGLFGYPESYFGAVDTKPGVIVSGDFTDDGVVDVAVASKYILHTGKICVFPGNGDLTLGSAQVMELGMDLRDLVTGDLNKDGRPDLVSVGNISDTMHVLLGKAGGGFAQVVDYTVSDSPTGVALGDFNEDTLLDAAVGYNSSSKSLQLFLNNGDGSFTPQNKIDTLYPNDHIRSADLDGDHHLDLVAVTHLGPSIVAVYLGDGTGHFAPALAFDAKWRCDRFDIGDVNSDGLLDVVVALNPSYIYKEGAVAVYIGNGDGSLMPPVYYDTMVGMDSLALGDLDLDGTLDIASTLLVMLNKHGPWDDLGHSLPGTFGYSYMTGEGPLVGGEFFRFTLSDGMPLSVAYKVIGRSQANLPFKGGVMVPSAEFITGPFPLDGQGRFEYEATWPAGVPPMSELYFQFWIQDAGGPMGFAATNGLKATTP